MGTTSPSGRFAPLLFGDVPLAEDAELVKDLKIARPGGIEHLLKCKAPSPERDVDGPYDYNPCTSFLAKAYFDEKRSSSFRDVCIVFNGLDETPHNLNSHELFGFYDALGRTLAEQGMLSILLPSPFHLNRSLVYRSDEIAMKLVASKGARFLDSTRPSNAMILAPYNLYLNHYQSFRELVSLCRGLVPKRFSHKIGAKLASVCATRSLVPEETSSLLRNKISPDARISLVGYSMGALRAMTAFCFTWEMAVRCDEEPLFTSCVALNAGGSFSSMKAPSWVDAVSWRAMVRKLNLETYDQELERAFLDERGTFEPYCKVIRDVTLGNALKFKQLEDRDAGFTRRLLFILGGSDDIMRLSSLHRITPPGGLNIFHVAGVGHMFRHGEWGTQLGGMLDHVGKFIAASSQDAGKLGSREVAEFLSLVDWKFGILRFDSRKISAGDGESSDISLARSNLEQLDAEEQAQLAALIVRPIGLRKDDSVTEVAVMKAEYGEIHTRKLAFEAVEFVRNRLLFELRIRIDKGECHPGLYGQTRRSLLLGWILTKNKILVRHWGGFTGAEKRMFGEELVERGVVPQSLVESALQEQRSLLEAIRAKMFRAFSLTCAEKGISLVPKLARSA